MSNFANVTFFCNLNMTIRLVKLLTGNDYCDSLIINTIAIVIFQEEANGNKII